jgi:hypothetical protein
LFGRRRAARPAGGGVPEWSRDLAGDDLIVTVGSLRGMIADCCCAGAAVRVRLSPATGGELLFCEHHFRLHEAALRGTGASAYDAAGLPLGPEHQPAEPGPAEAATSTPA